MKWSYHREARKELREAVLWYEDQRSGLGSELLVEVQKTLARVAENPRRFPASYRNLRQAFVPRFPYLIFFIPMEDRIEVFAVFHTSRSPEVWKGRVVDR